MTKKRLVISLSVILAAFCAAGNAFGWSSKAKHPSCGEADAYVSNEATNWHYRVTDETQNVLAEGDVIVNGPGYLSVGFRNVDWSPHTVTLQVASQADAEDGLSYGSAVVTNCGPVVGTPGPKGDKGDAGPKGATGATGAQGTPGANGTNGSPGKDGAPGPAGPQGFTGGTGPAGQNGAAGATGPAGASGGVGPAGLSITGATRRAGRQGVAGKTGAQGRTGAKGHAGANGKRGANGHAGKPGVSKTIRLTIVKTVKAPVFVAHVKPRVAG